MTAQTTIPGYTSGTAEVPRSPLTLADFERMKASVLFSDEDVKYLRLSHDVVKDQVEAILDVWYGFVASTPHLVASFTSKSTAPERNTTLMLLAATSSLRTGLIAEPISDALERKPKPTRARCEALPIPR